MKQLHVIISGGGTGGHIFPAIAIGKALQRLRPDTQLLYVGANGKMEMEKVPLEGFKIVGLDIVGFNRTHLLKNLTLPLKLLKSRSESRRIVEQFQPDVAVGVGGYASFPLLQAAQSIGIPTLIQEQNSHAGKTNKLLGKRAEAICVAYAGMERFFPASKILLTGNPVRKEIVHNTVTKASALQAFQLKDNVPTLLVIGGSLGALSINESIAQGLSLLMKLDIQVLWQTGTAYHSQALQHAAKYGGRVQAVAFIKDMASAYSAADVVISRAGALAIAELCIAGKPVIFVPYPHAAENHQMANALALVEQGAAMVVKDDEAKDLLVKRLHELLENAGLQERMAENISAMAIKDADERIAHKIIGLANRA